MVFLGVFVLLFAAVFGAYNGLWRRDAVRIHHVSSIVVADRLFLDAGEIVNYYKFGPGLAISGATLQIDLTSDWTTSNVKPAYALKPLVYPHARQPALWSDGTSLYSAGGIPFYFFDCTYSCQNAIWRPDPTLPTGGEILGVGKHGHVSPSLASKLQNVPIGIWQFPIDEFTFDYNGNAQFWFKASYQIPHGYSDLQGTVGTSIGDRFYAMSGFSGLPFGVNEITNWLEGVPGIASWNVEGSDWKNISTNDFQPGGTTAQGKGIPVPFGDKGSIVYLGGYAPKKDQRFNYTSHAALADMSQVNIFDTASETFVSQQASGQIPDPRYAFCAVGASESGSGTFDIFVFGGFSGTANNEPIRPSLQKVYVLSLPSFTWTETTAEKQQMRASSTCEVIGNRQMIVVGGSNPHDAILGKSADPWPNFMAIFDLSQWNWKFNYESKAPAYRRNELLVQADRKRKYPSKWDSQVVQDLFQKNSTTYPGTGDSGPDNLGVKIGVPIAVVILALLVAALIFWCWRRLKRNSEVTAPKKEEGSHYLEAPDQNAKQELSGEKNPVELGPFLSHELEDHDGSANGKTYSSISSKTLSVRHELQA